jgi:hypothetical protein
VKSKTRRWGIDFKVKVIKPEEKKYIATQTPRLNATK